MDLTTLSVWRRHEEKCKKRKEKKNLLQNQNPIQCCNSLFFLHSTSKQAINSIYIYRKREREREHARMIMKMDPANNKSHLQLPFSPLHTPQKSKSPSPEENGRSNIHACTPPKKKWETKQKKISKETQNVLWCFPSKDPKHTDCYQEQ